MYWGVMFMFILCLLLSIMTNPVFSSPTCVYTYNSKLSLADSSGLALKQNVTVN